MSQYDKATDDYYRIERAIRFIEENVDRQPELREIAAAANLSEYHFQRLFGRWVGITPKRFLQFLTKEHAKQLLAESRSLLDTAYESGLTGPGRLHDLFVACEAMTPGEYKKRGEGLRIDYGIHGSPFGDCLIARTPRGICHLSFLMDASPAESLAMLQKHWGEAEIVESPTSTGELLADIFPQDFRRPPAPLHLILKGTNFQIKVWEALIRIPAGALVSYNDVARMIGQPKAVRAVAGAVANNRISFIIPCHRVIRKMGIFHNYRWGSARKKVMLGWEAGYRANQAHTVPASSTSG